MKEKMNPKTKRAVVVLSIIALLILIAGLVSCSIQLSHKTPAPPIVTDSGDPAPAPSGGVTILEIDHGDDTLPPDDAATQNGGEDEPEQSGEGGKHKPAPMAPLTTEFLLAEI